jgi:hypothetical protein
VTPYPSTSSPIKASTEARSRADQEGSPSSTLHLPAHSHPDRAGSRLRSHDIEQPAQNLFVVVLLHDADLYPVGTLAVQAGVRNLTLYVRTQRVPVDKGLWSRCVVAATHPAPVELIELL